MNELTELVEPGEVSPALLPDESPVEPADDYASRVETLLTMIETDPSVRDRMLAEVYVTIARFDEIMRGMQTEMDRMGPGAFFKMIFGRK